jgi:hypothetical protein
VGQFPALSPDWCTPAKSRMLRCKVIGSRSTMRCRRQLCAAPVGLVLAPRALTLNPNGPLRSPRPGSPRSPRPGSPLSVSVQSGPSAWASNSTRKNLLWPGPVRPGFFMCEAQGGSSPGTVTMHPSIERRGAGRIADPPTVLSEGNFPVSSPPG